MNHLADFYRIKIKEVFQKDFLENYRKHKRLVAFINNWLETNGISYHYEFDDYCIDVLSQVDTHLTYEDVEESIESAYLEALSELANSPELSFSLYEFREELVKPMIRNKIVSIGYDQTDIEIDFTKPPEIKRIKVGKAQGMAKIHYVLHTDIWLRNIRTGDRKDIIHRQEVFEDAEPLVARTKVFDELNQQWEDALDSSELFDLNDKQLKQRGQIDRILYQNSVHIVVNDPERGIYMDRMITNETYKDEKEIAQMLRQEYLLYKEYGYQIGNTEIYKRKRILETALAFVFDI